MQGEERPQSRPRNTTPEEFPLSQPSGSHTKEAVARRVLEERLRDMPFQPKLVARHEFNSDLDRLSFMERYLADQRRREEVMSVKVRGEPSF